MHLAQWNRRSMVGVSLSFLATDAVLAGNWPQWRGATLDGISGETNLPAEFGPGKNEVWKLPLPGAAGSTPAVWGDNIFLTTVDGDNLELWCVSAEGQRKWKQVVSTGNKDVRGDEGNAAAPSPCTDGTYVWANFANGALACYAADDGKEVWKLNLPERYGKFEIAFGMTSTPVLDGDRLYLQLIHGEGDPKTREAIVVCLDAKTGNQIWKHDRISDAQKECEHSYASPVIYRDSQREFLITHGADFVMGHSLEDGHELWRCGNLNIGNYNPTLRFVASPVAAGGRIVVPSAKGGPVLCLKPDIEGDVTDKQDAYLWQRKRDTPDVPSPVVHEGLVYLCRENGVVICVDAETGEELYQKRAVSDRYRASPVIADGKLYVTARKGVVTVFELGKTGTQLAVNNLDEEVSASPAVANGRIYIRTFKNLYAFGNK